MPNYPVNEHGFEIIPSVYWKEVGLTEGYYGLHNDGAGQCWINMYKADGRFVCSVSRCFDYEGTVEQLKADSQIIFVTHKEPTDG